MSDSTSSYPYTDAVIASLERAAELGIDPGDRIYARLFAEFPQVEALFWRDKDGAIRGEMLARVFDAILDFVGERRYASHMIGTELITHEGYDVPREIFATFFRHVGEGLEACLGADWTPEMAAGWQAMLIDVQAYVARTPRSDVINSAFDRLRAAMPAPVAGGAA